MFYKILRSDLTHNGFTYKVGLNVDTVPFNPSGSCQSGGLYYTDIENLFGFLCFGDLIADIVIPVYAKTYADPQKDKWKADKLEITRITPIGDHELFKAKAQAIIKQSFGHALKYVKEQTLEISTEAVKQF